ncbi:MAG: sigma-70 family RNA polymerase sigma factor [Alphaproteobacteria bacterium]|nr:sigma-70 family RNA polymerase sigma factor [Alphaproteobacteria bacterium]
MDDDDLRRAARGDRTALRRVVQVWYPQMRRWALVTCGDPQTAEDAVQDALVRLVRFVGRYDPDRPFGPWLRTLVVNACRSQHPRPRPVPHEPVPSSDPDRDLDLASAAHRVRAAFAELSPRQREILDLVDVQHRPASEVAAELGLTDGAVRGQLFQARRAIRAVLLDGADILPLLREA